MLHITNPKIKLAQNFREERHEKHQEPRYYGNPMEITEQCEECGASYDEIPEHQLDLCMWCQHNFCPTCLGPHEAEHIQQAKNPQF